MKIEFFINIFIEFFVKELEIVWIGFYMKSFKCFEFFIKFRLVLICVGCDIFVSRKLCGFFGYVVIKGCNKCMKSFEGGVGEKNYGGFDVLLWELRNLELYKEVVKKIVKCKIKINRERLEKEYGVCYLVLLELEYFDFIRMIIIDLMYNLFLGIVKCMLILWKDSKILLFEYFNEI